MSEVIIQVELSEFRERVFRALPPFPDGITIAELTRKIYKSYDGKKDKYRRSHVMKAMGDLWRMKIASHTLDRMDERWTVTKYHRTRKTVQVRRKK
ncbi:MAG: hypothetical protein KAI64_05945 [Thermoplasmata archaeon]|nr:hypothetical protein [Thermoplasmata archaeon]